MATKEPKAPAKKVVAPKVGGFRENAGRKAQDNAVGLHQRSVNLTNEQHAHMKSVGGSVWLRGIIDKDIARAQARAEKAAKK